MKKIKSKEIEEIEEVKQSWGLEVHGVIAPVTFEEYDKAVNAIEAWKARGWEFVTVKKLIVERD